MKTYYVVGMGESTSVSFWFSYCSFFLLFAQLFRSCYQLGRSWCDDTYHKDSGHGNNNSHLGIWSYPVWQPCVKWILGCNCGHPDSRNQGFVFDSWLMFWSSDLLQIQSSGQRIEAFEKLQIECGFHNPLKIPLHSNVWWGTAHCMLSIAYKIRQVCQSFIYFLVCLSKRKLAH